MMNHIDLFSGIGGFALGLRMAGGFKTIAFAEINEWCHRTLKKHWPGAEIFKDIHDVTAESIQRRTGIRRIDIITAGIPCQPASVAGKQKGQDDDRWLWPQTIGIIDDIRPRWIVLENPSGIYGVGLSGILSGLESIGYANGQRRDGTPAIHALQVPACAVGAPIIRDRVFIVAKSDDSERRANSFCRGVEGKGQDAGREEKDGKLERNGESGMAKFDGERCRKNGKARRDIRERVQTFGGGNIGMVESKSNIRRSPWHEKHNPSDRASHFSKSRWLKCDFDGRYRRVPEIEPGFCGVGNGISGWMDGLMPLSMRAIKRSPESKEIKERLQAIGNSVNPQTVAMIGTAILTEELAK